MGAGVKDHYILWLASDSDLIKYTCSMAKPRIGRPVLSPKERRIVFSISVKPETLSYLDKLVAQGAARSASGSYSRSRVVEEIAAFHAQSTRDDQAPS